MPLPGSDTCVLALLGLEYPDPVGSGLSVPVLGCQSDLISGITIPLAGTMQDPDGKGTMLLQRLMLTYHLFNPVKYTIKHFVPFFVYFATLHRLSGDPLWLSDCRPSDRGVSSSGWSQAGCIQKNCCTSHSFLLANCVGSN